MEPLEMVKNDFNGEIFNIGSDTYYNLIDIADIVINISKKFGFNPKIKYLENRYEVKNAYCNHDKAKNILNFKDQTNMELLIYNMFKWAKDEQKREVKIMEYEINKNIYSYWKK